MPVLLWCGADKGGRAEWHLLKHFATEAHGMTRKKKTLIELFSCFSVCFRGQLGVFIDDTSTLIVCRQQGIDFCATDKIVFGKAAC